MGQRRQFSPEFKADAVALLPDHGEVPLLPDHGEVPLLLSRHLRPGSRRYDDVPELELQDGSGSPVAGAVAAEQTFGRPVEFYQVGRQTAGGFPVMRESQAIWDIWSVSDVPVTFVPYL